MQDSCETKQLDISCSARKSRQWCTQTIKTKNESLRLKLKSVLASNIMGKHELLNKGRGR